MGCLPKSPDGHFVSVRMWRFAHLQWYRCLRCGRYFSRRMG